MPAGDRMPDVAGIERHQRVVAAGITPAPAFDLSAPGGPLVLYFYPKDDTPGCTVEACNFRDNFARVRAAGGVPFLFCDGSVHHIKTSTPVPIC